MKDAVISDSFLNYFENHGTNGFIEGINEPVDLKAISVCLDFVATRYSNSLKQPTSYG